MDFPHTAAGRWIPLALSLALTVLVAACSRPSDSVDDYSLPLVEPSVVDQVDRQAIDRFQTSLFNDPAGGSDDAGQWPQLFGPTRNCVAAGQQVGLAWGDSGPPLLWSIEVGTGYGSPVVSGGRVVFNHRIDGEEIVQCVDAADGQTLWTHRYPTTFQCDVQYSNGPYSTPVIDQDRVYAVGGQGQLFCLAFDTGEPTWGRDLHRDYAVEDGLFPVGASPLIDDGRLIFNLGAVDRDAGIIAVSAVSGEDLWQSTDHPAGYCSPMAATIDGQRFLFVMTNVGLVALNPETGAMDWMVEHYSRSPMSYNAVSPLVVGNKVLIVTGPGPGAVCVQANRDRTFSEIWRDRRLIDSQYNTLMLSGNSVIGFTSAGQGGAELRCVDLESGKLRWRYHSLLRRGQGLVVDGALILLGERGHLAALLPGESEPQVLAFTAAPLMSEPCYCAPALADSRLYLKDQQRLACFDLSSSQ